MRNKILKAIVLATIMILSLAITPSLVRGDVATSSTSSSLTSNNTNLQQVLDRLYIGILGFTNNVTSVHSSVNEENGTTTGFTYVGVFSSSEASYSVNATQFKITNGNQVISTSTENITGGGFNTYASATQTATTAGNSIIKDTAMNYQISNSSGNYYMNLKMDGFTDSNDSNPLTSYAQLDQNFIEPIGNYSAIITSQPNSNDSFVSITTPNGANATFGFGSPSTSGTNNNVQIGTNNNVQLDSSPPGMDYAPLDPSPNPNGDYSMIGEWIFWAPGYYLLIGVVMIIIGAIVAAAGFLAGLIVTCIGAVITAAGAFPAQMEYDHSMVTYQVLYMYLVFYDIWGLWFRVPCWVELGYYSNYVSVWWINGGQNMAIPDGWFYFDALDPDHGLLDLYDEINNAYYNSVGPTDIWSTDPPPTNYDVTFQVYDESSNCYDSGLPFSIDGGPYVGISGSDVWIPCGEHSIQVPDSDSGGAFNCFFDGTNYYGNGADIPISGDETITAYYNYIPTYTVTVYAFDQMDNPVYADVYIDGNWAGTTNEMSVQVPLGIHTIEFSQWDYSNMEMCQDFTDQNNYDYYNTWAILPLTSDMTFTAFYLYW